MPRSIVLGRPWPVPGEPLFTAEDTEYALAWQEHLDGLCRGCGHPLVETTDPAGEDAYDPHSYVCFACAAAAADNRRFRSDGGAADSLDGRYFYTTREDTGD